ncbi:tRNA1(Val) (adenine(37)-N6)-methyltransferase [Sulfurospirillum arcachonense]|uniref:tRNA1(Val) (adenine(37)-N6)-methyltransferase n=1 Tax=Sulfurospirillum arcachonense TaxID=57666 RepID=UPI0004684D00|nr:methyltransferase [Sulfurospirillum arcachonense]
MSIDNTLYLFQYKEGYRYNSDSLLLYDFIIKLKPNGSVLDVGSGSGILGLLIKRDFPHIELSQIDVQDTHVSLTSKSAQHNSLDTEVFLGDIRTHAFDKKFDMIISNPPFYHTGTQKSENESLKISRHSDALPFEELVKAVSSNLKPRGAFVFCYDAKQIDTLMAILFQSKFKVNDLRFVHTKETNDASLVLIHAKKSSKSLCKILPPLYMGSKEVKSIYDKSKTKSILWEN